MTWMETVTEQTYAREPAWSCGLSGAFLGALGFESSSLLVHGSSGCGFAMRYGLSQHWKSFIPCPVTSLHEEDVIFGGSTLLEKAIERIEQINPSDVLFLLTSCSAEIIGEDVKRAAEAATPKYRKRIVAVDSGGASGNTFDGYNNFLLRLVDQLYPEVMAVSGAASDATPQIDVMGIIPYYDMFWRGDIKEIKRLCGSIGVEINSVISGACSLQTVANADKTRMTVSIGRHIGARALKRIRNRGGGTMEFAVAPVGFYYTKKFLMDIAKGLDVLSKAVEERIEQEELAARQVMLRGFDFAKVMFTSGRVAVIGEPSRTLGLTHFLINELGMRPVLVAFTGTVEDEELRELEGILAQRRNRAKVLVDQDGHTIRRWLFETKPNIVFGRSTDRVADMDKTVFITWQFPATDRLVVYDKPFLGYKGISAIIDDVINGFSRLWY